MTRTAFRIAVFLPRLAAGGAERVMLHLCSHWSTNGVPCDIVTASGGGVWEDRVPAGVRHINLDASKPLTALPALIRYLRRERPSALLSTIFPANVAAVLAASISRVPCVIREANRTLDDIRARSTLDTFVNHVALRLTYRHAARIVALTPDAAEHLAAVARVASATITVIPNPVPAPVITTQPRDPRVIVACGRLEPQKDFLTLIDAFSRVAQQCPARLVILGEGAQRPELEARVVALGLQDRVELPGYCSSPLEVFGRSGLFVLSSRWEGFPNVLGEALAAGCRVVATDASAAVRSLLDDGRLGCIVPPGDAAALADAMRAALESPMPSRSFAASGEDLATIASRYEALLRDAAGKPL